MKLHGTFLMVLFMAALITFPQQSYAQTSKADAKKEKMQRMKERLSEVSTENSADESDDSADESKKEQMQKVKDRLGGKSSTTSGSSKSKKLSKSAKSKARSRSNSGGLQRPASNTVFLNFGVGPAAHNFWGTKLSDQIPWLMGLELDFHVAVPPDVIRANMHRVPDKYKKFVSQDKEMKMSQLWMHLIPTALLVQPDLGYSNDYRAIGATWSGIDLGFDLANNDYFSLNTAITVPSISTVWMHGNYMAESKWIIGLGIAPYAALTLKFSERFHLTGKYAHNLYLPIATTEILTRPWGERERYTQHGVAAVILNFRIPYELEL